MLRSKEDLHFFYMTKIAPPWDLNQEPWVNEFHNFGKELNDHCKYITLMSISKELFFFKDFDHSLFLTNFTSLRNMNQKVWVYEFYSFGRGFLIYYQYALNLSPRSSGVHKNFLPCIFTIWQKLCGQFSDLTLRKNKIDYKTQPRSPKNTVWIDMKIYYR